MSSSIINSSKNKRSLYIRQAKGGSPIKVAIAGLILVFLFVGALVCLNLMSNSVSENVDSNTNYFDENNSKTDNSRLENEKVNEKYLLETHYRSSNISFAL